MIFTNHIWGRAGVLDLSSAGGAKPGLLQSSQAGQPQVQQGRGLHKLPHTKAQRDPSNGNSDGMKTLETHPARQPTHPHTPTHTHTLHGGWPWVVMYTRRALCCCALLCVEQPENTVGWCSSRGSEPAPPQQGRVHAEPSGERRMR